MGVVCPDGLAGGRATAHNAIQRRLQLSHNAQPSLGFLDTHEHTAHQDC